MLYFPLFNIFFNLFYLVVVVVVVVVPVPLLKRETPHQVVVVDKSANNKSNCVVEILLLFISKNKSAMSTILLFIFTSFITKNDIFLTQKTVIIYVQLLYARRN